MVQLLPELFRPIPQLHFHFVGVCDSVSVRVCVVGGTERERERERDREGGQRAKERETCDNSTLAAERESTRKALVFFPSLFAHTPSPTSTLPHPRVLEDRTSSLKKMVRFKNRYLLLQLHFDPKDARECRARLAARDQSALQRLLTHTLRDSIQTNFGDHGAARTIFVGECRRPCGGVAVHYVELTRAHFTCTSYSMLTLLTLHTPPSPHLTSPLHRSQ